MSRLVVITFARAGLGHLRVANAIIEGVPAGTETVFFSTTDRATSFFHRLSSINPVMRYLAEAMQHGLLEAVFTLLYTASIRARAGRLLPQIEAVINQQKVRPTELVFISTHFGLAHQLCRLKDQIKAKTGVDSKVVVVVTDDSPQRAWNVAGADLTIVPSRLTKLRLGAPNSKVVHYPLSLKLGKYLPADKFSYRQKQVDPTSRAKAKISLPVSGAAVGLRFYEEISDLLSRLEPRFTFYITSRDSDFTKIFLSKMAKRPYAKIHAFEHDRQVVARYDRTIRTNTISLEITKPSEQAFKALYSPRQVGGVILLFTRPIGRQEQDNLNYLLRNGLIPSREDQAALWRHEPSIVTKAKNWRGLRLPSSPQKAALFIDWCLKAGIFKKMIEFSGKPKSNGVTVIWEMINKI